MAPRCLHLLVVLALVAVGLVPTGLAAGAEAGASVPTKAISGVRQSKILGYSRQHRPIVAHELGNPAAPFKAVVLGSIHGYYEQAGEQVVAGIEALPIPTNVDLWVISTINPDGDALHQRGNANGVDLNRNWPNLWTYIPPAPADKFDQHYSGPKALSEPETVAMYNFLVWLHPNRMVSMHQPLAAVDSTDGGARDPAFRQALASGLGLPVSPLRCFSICHGSMTGWVTNHQSGAAITVEFPAYETPAYLRGQAARGVLSALLVGVKPLPVPPKPHPKVSGAIQTVSASFTAVTVTGWAFDPQHSSTSSTVTVFVAGRKVTVTAGAPSPAVDKTYRVVGNHGFVVSVPMPAGRYEVCVSGHALAGSTSVARFLGPCRSATVPKAVMQGHVDIARGSAAGIRAAGWVIDPLHIPYRSFVLVQISRHPSITLHATVVRPDINALWKTSGAHGFDVTVPLPQGRYWLTVTALATATSSKSVVLTSHEVDVPAH